MLEAAVPKILKLGIMLYVNLLVVVSGQMVEAAVAAFTFVLIEEIYEVVLALTVLDIVLVEPAFP